MALLPAALWWESSWWCSWRQQAWERERGSELQVGCWERAHALASPARPRPPRRRRLRLHPPPPRRRSPRHPRHFRHRVAVVRILGACAVRVPTRTRTINATQGKRLVRACVCRVGKYLQDAVHLLRERREIRNVRNLNGNANGLWQREPHAKIQRTQLIIGFARILLAHTSIWSVALSSRARGEVGPCLNLLQNDRIEVRQWLWIAFLGERHQQALAHEFLLSLVGDTRNAEGQLLDLRRVCILRVGLAHAILYASSGF